MASDPRDARYFALEKRDRSSLSASELRELIKYCDLMIEGRISKKARKSWIAYRSDLLALLS